MLQIQLLGSLSSKLFCQYIAKNVILLNIYLFGYIFWANTRMLEKCFYSLISTLEIQLNNKFQLKLTMFGQDIAKNQILALFLHKFIMFLLTHFETIYLFSDFSYENTST